jgi:hypothetical protein
MAKGLTMQNTNRESFAELLVETFSEAQSREKKNREKESARKKLVTRRAIEDYQESRRLRAVLDDYDYD